VAYAENAIVSAAGTCTLSITGAGNTLLTAATLDLESLSAATLTSLALTAISANLDLSKDDLIQLEIVSDNLDLTGGPLWLEIRYQFV
jgi:hypothetical protein